MISTSKLDPPYALHDLYNLTTPKFLDHSALITPDVSRISLSPQSPSEVIFLSVSLLPIEIFLKSADDISPGLDTEVEDLPLTELQRQLC